MPTALPRTSRMIVALAATSVIGLAGCVGPGQQDQAQNETPAPETVTATETTRTDQAPSDATTASGDTAAPTQPSPDPTPPANSPSPSAPASTPSTNLPVGPIGSEVTIAGQPATICIHGDGWGTNIWAGNENTSCEFVVETHYALVEGLNATTQNIRDYLRPEVSVTSPVTDETYNLHCAPQGEELVSCTGGEGAEVFFY